MSDTDSLLLGAYLIEIANDKAGAALNKPEATRVYNRFAFYKNLKVNNLNFFIYRLFFGTALAFTSNRIPALIFIVCQYLAVRREKTKRLSRKVMINLSPRSEYNYSLIPESRNAQSVSYHLSDLAALLSRRERFDCLKEAASFVSAVYDNNFPTSDLYQRSLKLHLIDVFKLCLFAQAIRKIGLQQGTVILDCHYERWSYLASKLEDVRLIIVQHGYLRTDLESTGEFGSIDTLYSYDKQFDSQFLEYFSKIKNFRKIVPKLELRIPDNGLTSVFVISSPASVELELQFITLLSPQVTVYLKLHPLYSYKHRYSGLDIKIEFISDNIDADYVVSYNSFLAYEYIAMKRKVFWLKDDTNYLSKLAQDISSASKN